jgi:hypothetical protein
MPAALDLFADQPPTVGPFHARGSDTSREAAERIRPSLAMRQAAVLGCLRDWGPQTAEEIADRLGWDRWVTQPRLSELRGMDPPRVRPTDERRRNRPVSGNGPGAWATVWAAL